MLILLLDRMIHTRFERSTQRDHTLASMSSNVAPRRPSRPPAGANMQVKHAELADHRIELLAEGQVVADGISVIADAKPPLNTASTSTALRALLPRYQRHATARPSRMPHHWRRSARRRRDEVGSQESLGHGSRWIVAQRANLWHKSSAPTRSRPR
jgi:hypothetical protein